MNNPMTRSISLRLILIQTALLAAVLACGQADQPPADVSGDALGSTRSNPLPLDYLASVDDMTIWVTGLERPEDGTVASGSIFNPTPESGEEYVSVLLGMTCNKPSDEACNINVLNFSLVGARGVVYPPRLLLAGVEDMFEGGDFYGGATRSGHIYFIIDSGDSDLVLRFRTFLGTEIFMSVEY